MTVLDLTSAHILTWPHLLVALVGFVVGLGSRSAVRTYQQRKSLKLESNAKAAEDGLSEWPLR
jgi:hypothetical protein